MSNYCNGNSNHSKTSLSLSLSLSLSSVRGSNKDEREIYLREHARLIRSLDRQPVLKLLISHTMIGFEIKRLSVTGGSLLRKLLHSEYAAYPTHPPTHTHTTIFDYVEPRHAHTRPPRPVQFLSIKSLRPSNVPCLLKTELRTCHYLFQSCDIDIQVVGEVHKRSSSPLVKFPKTFFV